jgi:NAD(P)-dependent dehydrogenase (short-subunit alcohol dehydrogenase family)
MTGAAPSPRLTGRTALVTGASRGIGRAVALALAREGAHVVIAARTVGALEELDDEIQAIGASATILQLDLKKLEKIDQLGPALYERWGKLDIVVGNAGYLGALTPVSHTTEPIWNDVMTTNLTANFRLIRTLDPLLQRSDAGRAVFLTSGAAAKATAYWGVYAVSKAALETLVSTYASELATTSVRANLFDPGIAATAMRAKAMPGEDPATIPQPADIAPHVVTMVLPDYQQNGAIVRYRDLAKVRA